VGAFAINALDVHRLRQGFNELLSHNPVRAGEVRRRAKEYVARVSSEFPGNSSTGILDRTEEAERCFADFANDEPCPALDPSTGTCDLYAARPMTCRVFGPPVRNPDGLGVCELCFRGASDEQIAACEMKPDPDHLEQNLLDQLDNPDETIVAFALAR
jgi:Fe-S-cluster containining protein